MKNDIIKSDQKIALGMAKNLSIIFSIKRDKIFWPVG